MELNAYQRELQALRRRQLKTTETTLKDLYTELVLELRAQLEGYAQKNGHLRPYQQTRMGELMALEREAMRLINAKFPSIRNEIFHFGKESYEQAYLFPYYEVYQRYGKSLVIPELLDREALSALDSVINGRTLSQRLYRERDKLASRATKEIALGSMMGKSVPEVSEALSRHAGISYRNAVRIIRTEGTRISGKATDKSIGDIQSRAREYGIQVLKKWLSGHDNRVRATHLALDGQIQDEDGYFTSMNGHKAKHPGGFGVASEDINCRCSLVTDMSIDGQSLRDIEKTHWAQYGGFGEWFEKQGNSKRVSGALNNENNPEKRHAEMYYESVRNRNKINEIERISKNTGFSKETIEQVYEHVFINKHDLTGGYKRFDPDYDMAQSWQRLFDGRNIQKHDIILLEHEFYESVLMKDGMIYEEAHSETDKYYNYVGALIEWEARKGAGNI